MSQCQIDAPGSWATFRRDIRLSGHQPLPGAIRKPGVAWRTYLGGPIFDAIVLHDGDGARLLLLYGGCVACHAINGSILWKSRALGIESIIGIADVDADGRVEIVATDGKSFSVIDAADGRLLCREYVGPPFAAGFSHTCALLHRFEHVGPGMQLVLGLLSSKEVVIYDFSAGAATPERTHILWMDDFFHATPLAVDIDNDGREELIITKYSAVYAFDPATGELKSTCRWSSGGTPKRNYGLFQARDLNRDGAVDLLVISDRVSRHIAVVENDGAGNLRNRWDRFIEHIYPNDEKEIRYTFESCVDIDGDGTIEIVVSIFNDTGDGRWWLEILDAWTGRVKHRMPDLYLRGIQRFNEGEPPLILASREVQRHPSQAGIVTAMLMREGELMEIWSRADAALVGRFRASSATRTVFRSELPPSDEIWTATLNGLFSIPLRIGNDLALMQYRDGEWSARTLTSEPFAAIIAIDDLDLDGEPELVTSDEQGVVRVIRADGTLVTSFNVGMRLRYGTGPYYMARPLQTPIVFTRGEERYCAVPDAGTRIHLLRWSANDGRPEPVWQMEGRGRVGPDETFHSVSAVSWEGEPMILMSRIGSGPAELRLVNTAGDVTRQWTFENLPAPPRVPPARMGIYESLLVESESRRLLVVSGYHSASMNSERTLCIEAESGRELWTHRLIGEGEDGRGFGPWSAMSIISNGDHPEALFLAKDTLCNVDLLTGEFVFPPWQLRPHNTAHLRRRSMTMDDFTSYGAIVPVDVDGDGMEEWAITANYGGFGVIDADHTVEWWRSAPLSTTSGIFAGIADVDGDGLPELGISQADGDFICLRADTGEEKWRLHLGQVASGVVTCDIDGDGRVEFVLATRDGELMAIGVSTSGCGLIKWRYDLGFSLGSPVIADVDGDGRSEVLVVSGDGFLYGIR